MERPAMGVEAKLKARDPAPSANGNAGAQGDAMRARPDAPTQAARRAPAEVLFDHISPYLGPHMTRTALKTFSARAVGKTPDVLVLADVVPLLAALRQVLRALIGLQQTDELLQSVRKELGL